MKSLPFSTPERRLAYWWMVPPEASPKLPTMRQSFAIVVWAAAAGPTARLVAEMRARKSARVEAVLVPEGQGRLRVAWTASPIWKQGTRIDAGKLFWLMEGSTRPANATGARCGSGDRCRRTCWPSATRPGDAGRRNKGTTWRPCHSGSGGC